jgi:hypothetical protein
MMHHIFVTPGAVTCYLFVTPGAVTCYIFVTPHAVVCYIFVTQCAVVGEVKGYIFITPGAVGNYYTHRHSHGVHMSRSRPERHKRAQYSRIKKAENKGACDV